MAKKLSKQKVRDVVLAIVFIILLGSVVLMFARIRLSQQEILYYCKLCSQSEKIDNGIYYSYTRAYCFDDVNNVTYCADFYVECNGNELMNVTRITDMIRMSDDWNDPREEGERKIYCRM